MPASWLGDADVDGHVDAHGHADAVDHDEDDDDHADPDEHVQTAHEPMETHLKSKRIHQYIQKACESTKARPKSMRVN